MGGVTCGWRRLLVSQKGASMKVLIVSGFLGSGKTTFIQELARRTGRDFVVYENEYGQADIDAQVLRDDAELEVWESVENCICCTGKQDFATSVLTIANTLDPEFLIVEPTGVAKLSAVLDNVDKVSYERISLLEPVCIVDWPAHGQERAAYPEIFDDQLASASTVVISKVPTGDVAAGEGLAGLVDGIRAAKPDSDIQAVPLDRIPDEWWEALLHRDLDPDNVAIGPEPAPDEGPDLDTFSLGHGYVPTAAHLCWLLDALVAGVFGDIVRAKGYVRTEDGRLRFDVVARRWAITGAEDIEVGEDLDAEEARCVFIGRSIERNFLREAFLPVRWRHREEREELDHSHCDHDHGHGEHDHGHGEHSHEYDHCEHDHGEHGHHDHRDHGHDHHGHQH